MKYRLQAVLVAALVLIATPTTVESVNAASAPSCGPTVYKSNGTPWRCRFADEFSGTKLNGKKWVAQRTALSGLSGDEADCWVNNPNNISVADGRLRLTSRQEKKAFSCNSPYGRYMTKYSSGSISTRGTFAQTYGRWEIRARFPRATVIGSHSALWLYPLDHTYGDWPKSGEIDIAEYYTRLPDRVIPVIHYNAKGKANRTLTNKRCMVADPWSFHRYGVVWTPSRITITIDGKTCVDHAISARRPLRGAEPFDRPFVTYLTQSLGVGQNNFRPGTTPLPLRTEVDWVHVWS